MLHGTLGVLGVDHFSSGECIPLSSLLPLPKYVDVNDQLRKAILVASQDDDIDIITRQLYGTTVDLNEDDRNPVPFFDPESAPDVDWEEGVEEWKGVSDTDIWNHLGRPSRTLPYFNAFVDSTGLHDPWDHPEYFDDLTNPDIEPLSPRWNQLVGVIKGLTLMFEGKPLLLMDGVGFGKTLQLIAIFSILVFFREEFVKNGRFPGIFGMILRFIPMSLSNDSL